MLERGEALRKFPWPTLDAAAAASLLRWILAAAALAVLVWGIERWLRLGERLRRASAEAARAP